MNQALCQKLGAGAFPQASEVATADPKALQLEAGLGYRAKSIVQLAQQVSCVKDQWEISCKGCRKLVVAGFICSLLE